MSTKIHTQSPLENSEKEKHPQPNKLQREKMESSAEGHAPLPKKGVFKNLLGRVFGRLTVIKYIGKKSPLKSTMWLCRCSCGITKPVASGLLIRGSSKSCGCLQRELQSARMLKHGKTDSIEFHSWTSMKGRCNNPNDPAYKRYGGVGIRVCDRWMGPDGFVNFISDLGPRPSIKFTLDRFPDKRRNYEPSNCRWATWKEQGNNKKSVRFITHDGITLCLSDWEKRMGFCQGLMSYRLKAGWSEADAITTPKGRYRESQAIL